jgi:hypothetical protein
VTVATGCPRETVTSPESWLLSVGVPGTSRPDACGNGATLERSATGPPGEPGSFDEDGEEPGAASRATVGCCRGFGRIELAGPARSSTGDAWARPAAMGLPSSVDRSGRLALLIARPIATRQRLTMPRATTRWARWKIVTADGRLGSRSTRTHARAGHSPRGTVPALRLARHAPPSQRHRIP